MIRKHLVGISGGGKDIGGEVYEFAYKLGIRISKEGYILVCGGLGGVMEAACKGAKKVGGTTVGILPGGDISSANAFVDIPIATNMEHARNVILVTTAEVLVAVDGEYGTLSEIALALKMGKPVLGWQTCYEKGVISVQTIDEIAAYLKGCFPEV